MIINIVIIKSEWNQDWKCENKMAAKVTIKLKLFKKIKTNKNDLNIFILLTGSVFFLSFYSQIILLHFCCRKWKREINKKECICFQTAVSIGFSSEYKKGRGGGIPSRLKSAITKYFTSIYTES